MRMKLSGTKKNSSTIERIIKLKVKILKINKIGISRHARKYKKDNVNRIKHILRMEEIKRKTKPIASFKMFTYLLSIFFLC